MTRRTSHTPNLSAINISAMDKAERIARIRAEARAEAADRVERLSFAKTMPETASYALPRGHGSNIAVQRERADNRQRHKDDVENLRTDRDPCPKCGVRADLHAEFGCKRWRG